MIKDIVGIPFLGLPLFAWGGMTIFLLIVFQVLVGMKILKVDFKWHRLNGKVILGLAFLHGLAALSYLLGF